MLCNFRFTRCIVKNGFVCISVVWTWVKFELHHENFTEWRIFIEAHFKPKKNEKRRILRTFSEMGKKWESLIVVWWRKCARWMHSYSGLQMFWQLGHWRWSQSGWSWHCPFSCVHWSTSPSQAPSCTAAVKNHANCTVVAGELRQFWGRLK